MISTTTNYSIFYIFIYLSIFKENGVSEELKMQYKTLCAEKEKKQSTSEQKIFSPKRCF